MLITSGRRSSSTSKWTKEGRLTWRKCVPIFGEHEFKPRQAFFPGGDSLQHRDFFDHSHPLWRRRHHAGTAGFHRIGLIGGPSDRLARRWNGALSRCDSADLVGTPDEWKRLHNQRSW